MKRKIVCGIVLCLAFVLAGCGKNSKEKQAANYYQNELGLDKEEAEELAKELYGDDDEDTGAAEKESGEIVVEPLPEFLNSEWYEEKIQILDMVFSNDMYMTEEDVRRIVEGSAYDVELKEGFDDDGNVVPEAIMQDGYYVTSFEKSTRGKVSYGTTNDMVTYGMLEDGEYYLAPANYIFLHENWYNKASTEFVDLGTRDDVLACLSSNGIVEVEKEQSTYPSFDKDYSGTQFEIVYAEDSPIEFADTPYYYSQGVQSITFYRMHELGRTDQTIEKKIGYKNYIFSGAHLNLVNCVTFEFGTDGTVTDVKWGMNKFIVYED